MNFRSVSHNVLGLLPLLLLALSLLAGCAGKRWESRLNEDENSKALSAITALQETYRSCPDSLDADIKIFIKSPTGNSGIAGYLQLASPSHIKFILSNPLGMMLYAFASDGNTFQILDTSRQQHIRGGIRSLAIRKKLPLVIAEGDWFSYLTGYIPSTLFQAEQVYRDASDQTIWIPLARQRSSMSDEQTWLHLDLQHQQLLGYLFLDRNGKTLAEISYGNPAKNHTLCAAKEKTQITGLPWGAKVIIELHNISTATRFTESDFVLPVPTSYSKQLVP